MIFIFKYFVPKHFIGITIYPFIFLRESCLKEDETLVNHEKIHLRQQIEFLILPFYIWYVLEFLYRLLQYKDRNKAYKNISFEREAYRHESDLYYLKERKFWSFMKYL